MPLMVMVIINRGILFLSAPSPLCWHGLHEGYMESASRVPETKSLNIETTGKDSLLECLFLPLYDLCVSVKCYIYAT